MNTNPAVDAWFAQNQPQLTEAMLRVGIRSSSERVTRRGSCGLRISPASKPPKPTWKRSSAPGVGCEIALRLWFVAVRRPL